MNAKKENGSQLYNHEIFDCYIAASDEADRLGVKIPNKEQYRKNRELAKKYKKLANLLNKAQQISQEILIDEVLA
jgi:hypothetical protein